MKKLLVNMLLKQNDFDPSADVYFSRQLAELYTEKSSEVVTFSYKKKDDVFNNISIKRQISQIGSTLVSGQFFDLETPYGFGGYRLNTDNTIFLKEALKNYKEYCIEHNIIAEFIRFHPFCTSSKIVGKELNFISIDRDVVYIDCAGGYDSIRSFYKQSLRRNIKKASKANLKFQQAKKTTKNISIFIDLYHRTMERNRADTFYFFSLNYFRKLFNLPFVKLYVVKEGRKVINAIIVFESWPNIYYHLGATDPEKYHLNGNAFILDSIIRQYCHKYKKIFLGGGTTNSVEDTLLMFKRKFSPNTLGYSLGGLVIDERVYYNYLKIWKKQNPHVENNFFLKYRS